MSFNIENIHIIGVGGNGSIFAINLVKYLNNVQQYPVIHLYDDDKIEQKNTGRQEYNFHDINRYKVEILSNKLIKEYRYPYVAGHCFKITNETSVIKIMQKYSNSLFVLCVDNVPSRLVFWNVVSKHYNHNAMLIDMGNTDVRGQIITYLKYRLKEYGGNAIEEYPNDYIIDNSEHHSCEDEIEHIPQTLTANLITTTVALQNLIQYMETNTFNGVIEWYNDDNLLVAGKRDFVFIK